MLRKVVSKKRRPIDGPEDTKEYVFFCESEEEVLSLLKGYRDLGGNWSRIDAGDLLNAFDPCRPHRSVVLVTSAGDTDTISLHTLH